jgi:hypothetical protein
MRRVCRSWPSGCAVSGFGWKVCTARKMLADPEITIKEVAEAFGVNRATIYRSLGLGSYAKEAMGAA